MTWRCPWHSLTRFPTWQSKGPEKEQWNKAVDGLLGQILHNFFPPKEGGGVLEEIACEATEACDNNQILYKGVTATFLATTALLIPSTYDRIFPKIQSSASSAAKTCTGHGNSSCGVRWYGNWDGWSGMEEQISATNIFSLSLLDHVRSVPVTASTGGNSTSDPNAGKGDPDASQHKLKPITAGDRAGAGILTAIFLVGVISGTWWLVFGA